MPVFICFGFVSIDLPKQPYTYHPISGQHKLDRVDVAADRVVPRQVELKRLVRRLKNQLAYVQHVIENRYCMVSQLEKPMDVRPVDMIRDVRVCVDEFVCTLNEIRCEDFT